MSPLRFSRAFPAMVLLLGWSTGSVVVGAAEPDSDTIWLVNGSRLECKVREFVPGGLLVAFKAPGKRDAYEYQHFTMVVPTESVKRVEYSNEKEFDLLLSMRPTMEPEAWYRALYGFARKAEARADLEPGHLQYARGIYVFLLKEPDRPGVPDDAEERLALLSEKDGDPREALIWWRKVRDKHPNHGGAASAVARLTADADALKAAGRAVVREAAAVPPDLGLDSAKALADLRIPPTVESTGDWSVLEAGYNRAASALVDDPVNGLIRELAAWGGKPGDKAVFVRKANPQKNDLSKAAALTLNHVYLEGDEKSAVNISLAITTGPRHEWFESAPETLTPGEWNQKPLRFDLKKKNWKSEAGGWNNYIVAPENLAQTRAIHILIMNGAETVKCYIAGLNIVSE